MPTNLNRQQPKILKRMVHLSYINWEVLIPKQNPALIDKTRPIDTRLEQYRGCLKVRQISYRNCFKHCRSIKNIASLRFRFDINCNVFWVQIVMTARSHFNLNSGGFCL